MENIYLYTFGSVLIVSLISLIGVVAISISDRLLKSMVFILVSLSAGALFGDALIHLIPEALEEADNSLKVSLLVILGIVIFFILEKFLHWHHAHGESLDQETCPPGEECIHPTGWMILVSDGFHNFLDGLIIAGSYLVSIPVGIATTIAVILHEIPQEIGDFGVLINSGFKKVKALFYNFLSAVFSVVGAAIVLFSGLETEMLASWIVPFAAGGFLYIAGSDLIPELQKTTNTKKSLVQLFSLIIGVTLMALLVFLE